MSTATVDPLLGAVLDRRYHVEQRIARGGMATVYRAVDLRLDRTVAVKVMHPVFADDEEFVARFIREARSAARLSHPNVVSVFDQGADAGQVFIVMEYVPGRTLRDLLRERRRLDPVAAVSVLEPVLSALAAAHHAGIVHRDVKPENVLLSDDGRVKVADFGLARAVEGSTLTATTGLLIGTVGYLAPEQVARGQADARTDVYAAGILLVEMLTGAPPYGGDSPLSVAYRHVHEDVPAPSALVEGVPPRLDRLAVAATRRDPTARPADAGTFLAALQAAMQADVIPPPAAHMARDRPDPRSTLVATRAEVVRPPVAGRAAASVPSAPAAPEPPSYRRRRRGLVTLLIVLLIAAAAGAAGWWLGSGRWIHHSAITSISVFAGTTQMAAYDDA